MTAEFLWINIPLMAVAFALCVSVPMWMILRHPDRYPRQTHALPPYLRSAALPEQREAPGRDDRQRELVSAA